MRPKKCLWCGRVGEHGLYCSDACKQKAYRKRAEERRVGSIKGASEMLFESMGATWSQPVFDELRKIKGKENQRAAGQAVWKVLCHFEAELTKIRQQMEGQDE